jgi:hypothetical protein
MTSNSQIHRRLVRLTNLPVAGLLALLQRTPIVQVASTAEEFVLASPVGTVLRSAAAVAASLGALHSMAGATALVAADTAGPVSSPYQATVGTPIPTIAFTVSGTATGTVPKSWTVAGTIPPGLSFDGLTAPGDDTVAVTSALTGTPTKSGTYVVKLTGYDFANTTSGNSSAFTSSQFSFTVDVSAGSGGGGGGGSTYNVNKDAVYVQGSASGAVASSKWPYVFGVQAPTAVTLGLPAGGGSETVPANSGNGDFEINQHFASKSSLDAAYPDGTYQFTGTGIPALSFPLTTDAYPAAIPSVVASTNATWSGGVLMIDPTKASTLNFSTFSTYATAGVGGYMQFQLNDQLMNSKNLSQSIISVANSLGVTQQSTPFTSYAIPSGTLNGSDIYEAQLQFTTAVKFDQTTVSGSAVLGMFQNVLAFFVVTPPAGSSVPAPVIATDLPANQTGYLGQSVTLSPTVTVGGLPISGTYAWFWYLNGQQINVDGTKYVSNGTSLTINTLTSADAGVYEAKFVNFGGVASTSETTLAVTTQPKPVFTTQPVSQTLNVGSTVVFTVAATGATSGVWYKDGVALNDSPGGQPSDIITGANGPQLVIVNATTASEGNYTLVATNSAGDATSSQATLSMVQSSSPGTAGSLSSRAFVGTGDNILIGGFYIVGNTSRTILVQALGPALSSEGVSNVLQNPTLQIHQYQNGKDVVLYSNRGWGSSQVLLNAAAAVFAFPVLQQNAPDSELLVTLPPGGYTAEVFGADAGTGVALCGIYQLP